MSEANANKISIVLSEISVAYALTQTAHYFKLASLNFFKEKDFETTPEQFAILYAVYCQDGLYQRQLAQIAMKDRPNITRMLDILSSKGFVTRKVCKSNRRIISIFLTPEGKKEVEKILPVIKELREQAKTGISEKEIEFLKSILSKIKNNLEPRVSIQI